jgi:DNA replication protein DnaC
MIKVVYGTKGIGKTKYLIANANALTNECNGEVVFINRDNSLVTDLKHEIRYVDISDFPITTLDQLLAFICGLIAENFDIEAIFVDGLAKYEAKQEQYPVFFEKIKNIAEKFNTKFTFSVSGDISGIPEFVNKEYSC